ncbi:MAG: SPOR domain-containing protein, partial [Gammaproteobacteria bacterium]
MDRQLAERMVGAACILAVLVLVVPAILDGNPDSGTTITHPAVEEQLDLRTHTILLDGARSEPPVPTARQPDVAPELPQAKVQPPAPAPPEPDEAADDRGATASPTPAVVKSALPIEPVKGATTGGWFVQLGSFSRRENADRLAADLKGKGFSASV